MVEEAEDVKGKKSRDRVCWRLVFRAVLGVDLEGRKYISARRVKGKDPARRRAQRLTLLKSRLPRLALAQWTRRSSSMANWVETWREACSLEARELDIPPAGDMHRWVDMMDLAGLRAGKLSPGGPAFPWAPERSVKGRKQAIR